MTIMRTYNKAPLFILSVSLVIGSLFPVLLLHPSSSSTVDAAAAAAEIRSSGIIRSSINRNSDGCGNNRIATKSRRRISRGRPEDRTGWGIVSTANSISASRRRRRRHRHPPSQQQIVQRLRGGEGNANANDSKVGSLLQALDVFGTVVFAFSGALKAGKKGMDIIGMLIIASITAVGGGTLRDVLMGPRAGAGGGVFWMKTPFYVEICWATAIVTYFLGSRFGFRDDSAVFICAADALGLAAFCVIGAQQAKDRGLAPTLWIVSGLMSATFGGMIRDVICGEQPRIMYPERTVYSLGPALGATAYTVLDRYCCCDDRSLLNSSSVTIISFLVAFFVRVLSFEKLSFNRPWRMPHWNDGGGNRADKGKRDERIMD